MNNFNSASLTSIHNAENGCEYQNFILQQKQLMQKIHSQEKKLKNYHRQSSANPGLMSSSFVKRYNSFNSKYDRPEMKSCAGGFDRLKQSIQTVSTLCAPMPLISSALPSASKHCKAANSENNLNRHINFIF